MRAPDVFVTMDTVPKDIIFKPTCTVLGPPSGGKSDICQRISSITGAIHLKLRDIIDELRNMDSVLGKDVRNLLENGKDLTEDLTV